MTYLIYTLATVLLYFALEVVGHTVISSGLLITENCSTLFGISADLYSYISLLLIFIIFFVGLYERKKLDQQSLGVLVPYVLITSGGLHNAFSRFASGCVSDYIPSILFENLYFNLADIFIVVGLLTWFCYNHFVYVK